MSRKLDGASPDVKISDWKDMEHFLKVLMSNAWNRDKKNIQILYRETTSLDKKTMLEVLKLESDFIKWVAENLRAGLGLPSTSLKLEMIANLADQTDFSLSQIKKLVSKGRDKILSKPLISQDKGMAMLKKYL